VLDVLIDGILPGATTIIDIALEVGTIITVVEAIVE